MAITVTLDDQAAKAFEMLRRQAAALGISLDRYLSELAANGNAITSANAPRSAHDMTLAEFRKWLVEVSVGMPPVPLHGSR